MSGVGGVGSGANVAQLMEILQSSQQQNTELAKKMILLANTNPALQNEAEGKGLNFDTYA